ncbi:MAG: hypothetical protein JNK64_24300 [Myxococcales bacterium]|nr:hypothetical protein [Myxococcales bacterium]
MRSSRAADARTRFRSGVRGRTIVRDDDPGVMGDAARGSEARVSTHEERFHEEWLGMVQPVDGLVVSIPVLVEAQCLERQPPERQRALAATCMITASGAHAIADVGGFITDVLGWQPAWVRGDDALPAALSLYVPEGQQVVKPTAALVPPHATDGAPMLLIWDLGRDATGLPFDRPEVVTGPWEYPVAAKFDRLLRHCRVPIGVLTNRTAVRLIYAPHGASSHHRRREARPRRLRRRHYRPPLRPERPARNTTVAAPKTNRKPSQDAHDASRSLHQTSRSERATARI